MNGIPISDQLVYQTNFFNTLDKLPQEALEYIVISLDKFDKQAFGLTSDLCNKKLVFQVKNNEIKALKNFVDFLTSQLDEKLYPVQKQKLIHLHKGTEIFSCENLSTVKLSILKFNDGLVNILSTLDVEVLKQLQSNSKEYPFPTFCENVFPLAIFSNEMSKKTFKLKECLNELLTQIGLPQTLKRVSMLKKNVTYLAFGEIISLLLEKDDHTNAIKVFKEQFLNLSSCDGIHYKKIQEIYKMMGNDKLDQADDFIHQVSKTNLSNFKAFADIARELLQLGEPYKALEAINKIPKKHVFWFRQIRCEVLKDISLELLKRGDVDRVLKIVEELFDENIKFEILACTSNKLLTLGNIDRAIEVINQIPNQTSYSAGSDKFKVLSKISLAALKQGPLEISIDKAVKIANSIFDKEIRSKTLKAISDELFNMDLLDNALEVALKIDDISVQLEALKPIFLKLMTKGATPRVIAIVEKMDVNLKSLALQFIAEELAKAGNLDKALELLNKIQNEVVKSRALVTISKELFKDGKIEKAIELCLKISITYEKYSVISDFCNKLFILKKSELAINLSLELINQQHLSDSSITILKTSIDNGGLDRIIGAIKKIDNIKQRNTALFAICQMLIKHSYFYQSTRLVNEILVGRLNTKFNCEMLEFICEGLFNGNYIENAVALAKTMPDEKSMIRYLKGVCERNCDNNDIDLAYYIANSVSQVLVSHIDLYLKNSGYFDEVDEFQAESASYWSDHYDTYG